MNDRFVHLPVLRRTSQLKKFDVRSIQKCIQNIQTTGRRTYGLDLPLAQALKGKIGKTMALFNKTGLAADRAFKLFSGQVTMAVLKQIRDHHTEVKGLIEKFPHISISLLSKRCNELMDQKRIIINLSTIPGESGDVVSGARFYITSDNSGFTIDRVTTGQELKLKKPTESLDCKAQFALLSELAKREIKCVVKDLGFPFINRTTTDDLCGENEKTETR